MDLVLKQPPNSAHSVKTSQTRSHPRIRLQVPVFLRSSDATGTEFIELTKTLTSPKTSCRRTLAMMGGVSLGTKLDEDDEGAGIVSWTS